MPNSHTAVALASARRNAGVLLREMVFGAQDGLVSTVGFVSGIHIATGGSARVILLAGTVQLLSGAFSMAAGSYLSTKAEQGLYERERFKGEQAVANHLYHVQEELLEAFVRQGMPRDRAYQAVALIAEHKNVLTRTFYEKVLGLGEASIRHPLSSATLMGFAFCCGALVPLLPYLLGLTTSVALVGSIGLTVLAIFGIGVARARWFAFGTSWLTAGLEFVGVAMGAALVGYAIGALLPQA